MAWTTPRTWIAGELVTASICNTHIRDNLQNRYDDGGVLHSYHQRTGFISESLGADVNNWNPTGLSTCSIIRITASGATRSITGITAQPAGTVLTLVNVNVNNLNCNTEDANSTAANRFVLGATITANTGRSFWYDSGTARWRLLDS